MRIVPNYRGEAHAELDLTLDQLDISVAAMGQLCGKAQAAGESDLLDRASALLRIFEDAAKALRRES